MNPCQSSAEPRRAAAGSLLEVLAIVCALAVVAPGRVAAWGITGHRLINESAIDNLPDEMFDDGSHNGFNAWRESIRVHAMDPDNVRGRGGDPNEGPRHYCNLDFDPVRFPPPYDTVPRDYDSYVAKVGRDRGVVMWEGIAEHADGLRVALKTRNWVAARIVASHVGHYVGDAHSPLHATANHNGHLTWHDGIHARHESTMVTRHVTAAQMITRRGAGPEKLGGACEFVDDLPGIGWAAILEDLTYTDEILYADEEAFKASGKPFYNAKYYEILYAHTGAFTVARLNTAARRLADVWYTAWVQAGRPRFDKGPLPLDVPALISDATTGNAAIDGVLRDFPDSIKVFQTNVTDARDNDAELNRLFVAMDRTTASGDAAAAGLRFGAAGNFSPGTALVLLLDTREGGMNEFPAVGPGWAATFAGAPLHEELKPDFGVFVQVGRGSSAGATPEIEVLLAEYAAESTRTLDLRGAIALDNSNRGGVRDFEGRTVGDSENVRTGLEFTIPLAELKIAAGLRQEVRALAFLVHVDPAASWIGASGKRVTIPGAARLSNQFLPGMVLGDEPPEFDHAADIPADFSERAFVRLILPGSSAH